MSSKLVGGPLFNVADAVLQGQPEYVRFRAGASVRAEYASFLDSHAAELIAAGVPPDDVEFAKRYPRSETDFVSQALADLLARGMLPTASYDAALFDEVRAAAQAGYDHGGFRTYIYPEEARLLFAIAEIARPRAAIFLGSYYGYWAFAASAAIVRAGGRVVLVDPDDRAQSVASRNLAQSSYGEAVEIAVTTGEHYLDHATAEFDLVVLDAEGPRNHPDPSQRGKRVYTSLLRHSLPRLASGALLVCHNILFQDHSTSPFFDGVIARNHEELGEFMELARQEFPGFQEYPSTEGVGVGRRTV